jgi:uncharacterized protein YjiS (DUF1127 family)
MRNYVMMQAQQRQAYGRLSVIVRVWQNWNTRKDLKRLMAMDDYMLRDLGLTRELLDRLTKLPLTIDQVWERERSEKD